MGSKVNLLAIIGSQRKYGNSYLLVKTVLESSKADYEIIQLAEKEIEFCNLCEKCIDNDCVLKDDFNNIFDKMQSADGIIFAVPKYLFVTSKFLCFLERLDTIHHMRKHGGYKLSFKNPDYALFSKEKPFCVFFASGTGEIENETMKIVADYIECLGLKLIPNAEPPFVGVSVKAGDSKGDVFRNRKGIKECKKLVEKVLDSIQKGDSATSDS